MKDFLARLTSRKLWISIATLSTLAANGQWQMFAAVGVSYVLAQGGADFAQAFATGKTVLQQANEVAGMVPAGSLYPPEDDVDKGVITSGVITPTP